MLADDIGVGGAAGMGQFAVEFHARPEATAPRPPVPTPLTVLAWRRNEAVLVRPVLKTAWREREPVLRLEEVVSRGERGFTNLAVFGSVARREARPDSDMDLLVEAPPGTTISGLLSMQDLLERILGRAVDLITYGGLNARLDGDIRSEAVLL